MGGVQNRENAEATSVHSIGDDIRCARHDEFPRFGFAPGMPEVRMLGKPFRRLEDALSQSACGRRLVLFDILSDFDEVGDGSFGPDYSHDGGGNSRFLPHERNQRAASS